MHPKDTIKYEFILFFVVKYNGRQKARLVAAGHVTPDPVESIYSGVVSLRNLKLVIFLGKLNNLELWGAEIGNAYLEAPTEEKLYIVAGPEFEDLEGLGLWDHTIHTYLNKIIMGLIQFMAMFKKLYLKIFQMH